MKKLFISIMAVLMVAGFTVTSVSAKSHEVEKGDTLWSIADSNDMTVKKLKNKNDLSSDIIHPGQELTINKKKKDNSSDKKVKAGSTSKEKKEDKGETLNVTSTAYTAQCTGCTGVTATGVDLNKNPDKKIIAVDPDVIPLGSEVHVEGYGDAVAADTGGAINGEKIDVHVPNEKEAMEWGNKDVEVTILD